MSLFHCFEQNERLIFTSSGINTNLYFFPSKLSGTGVSVLNFHMFINLHVHLNGITSLGNAVLES